MIKIQTRKRARFYITASESVIARAGGTRIEEYWPAITRVRYSGSPRLLPTVTSGFTQFMLEITMCWYIILRTPEQWTPGTADPRNSGPWNSGPLEQVTDTL